MQNDEYHAECQKQFHTYTQRLLLFLNWNTLETCVERRRMCVAVLSVIIFCDDQVLYVQPCKDTHHAQKQADP